MNPTVAAGGRSFKGAFQYYFHDKKAKTRERVAWTHSVNILTDDPEKAWKVMAYTARHQARLKEAAGLGAGGRKLQKPVMAYSLSWHPEQKPSPDHMRETALASLEVLGLAEHEAMIVAHSDTPHMHVHVVVNRVHPLTGKVASDSYTYRKLSDFALEYDVAHGLDTSPQRAENKKKREKGEKTEYRDPKIAEAWAVSDDGKSLKAALEARGYVLAQGKKCIVVVDTFGNILNPVRHIEGVKTKDFRGRLKDVGIDGLPDAKGLAKDRAARHEQEKANARKKDATEKPKQAEPENVAPERHSEPRKERTPENEPPPKSEPQRDEMPSGKSAPAKPETSAKEQPNDEWAALRLNRIQDRQIQDRADLFDYHHRRILKERDELTKFYRLNERRAEIDDMRQRCANPPWWRRWFGFADRDREALEVMALNLASAQGRFDERVKTMEEARSQSLEALRITQAREWEVAVRLNRAAEQAHSAMRENERVSQKRTGQRSGYGYDR